MSGKPVGSWVGRVLLAACALQVSPPAAADDALAVSRYGFCITEAEGRCLEVAMPGAVVDYERLPQDDGGNRYIGFYSRQQARKGLVLVHLLYGEDQDSAVRYVLPEPPAGDAAALRRKLEQVLAAHPGSGSIVVTALAAAGAGATPRATETESFVFSRIAVPGPGEFSARVVGLDGKLAPGTDPVQFSVIRLPPAN